jgi:hypothetical protein
MTTNPLLRPSGVLITTFLDSGKVVMQDTVQCCHCGGHFLVTPGSGTRRGFCCCCGHATCGKERCDPCVPSEQWLENQEQGKPDDYRRIIVPGGFGTEEAA